MMELTGYLASALIGLSLGMMGGGGSILTVPVLVYFFGVDAVSATTYSLCIVGVASLAGSIDYYSRRQIDFRMVLTFGIPSVSTVFVVRNYLLPAIPRNIHLSPTIYIMRDDALMMVLAGLMVISALSMIRKSGRKPETGEMERAVGRSKGARLVVLIPAGILTGLVTGLLGAGGGFLIIPVLVLGMKLPMKRAIGTSLSIITINALTGLLFSVTRGTYDWNLFLSLSLIAIAGIILGSRISSRVSGSALRRGFGIFLFLVSAFIFSRSFETGRIHLSTIKKHDLIRHE